MLLRCDRRMERDSDSLIDVRVQRNVDLKFYKMGAWCPYWCVPHNGGELAGMATCRGSRLTSVSDRIRARSLEKWTPSGNFLGALIIIVLLLTVGPPLSVLHTSPSATLLAPSACIIIENNDALNPVAVSQNMLFVNYKNLKHHSHKFSNGVRAYYCKVKVSAGWAEVTAGPTLFALLLFLKICEIELFQTIKELRLSWFKWLDCCIIFWFWFVNITFRLIVEMTYI